LRENGARQFENLNEDEHVVEKTPDPEQPVAWRAVLQDTKVRSSDGREVGTVSDLLGSNQEDIFHGIVVHLGKVGHNVLVSSDNVSVMTRSYVAVSLSSDQIRALPKHAEEHEYHLGVTGLFRKRPGWIEDKDR
jgi:hypothetical protein